MKDETISSLRKFTLEMRALLESEINEQLEGIYGFLPNGSFESKTKYPALKELEEAIKTRSRLEHYIVDEKSIGMTPQDARHKLIRETAYTWLNRFVAFKMMETRKLIKETITCGPDSNGFKLWLTESGNEKAYQKYEAGDFPQNHIGEGPRQEAYRQFLFSHCRTLTEEIHVLFNPDNLQSRLFPRPRVLLKIFECMNKDDLNEAWKPGNDETIGWVYQFFNSEELEKAFREARESGKKFDAKDIPSVTQLFTPRWIVKFLMHNSLGRLWLDMHPDSEIADKLEYLVLLIGERPGSPLKPVSEIRFLDPACGSMHFGLIAFDIFMFMYQEELEKAGHDGWPDKPSCNSPKLFPTMIIAQNIYGIDIDLRAVQLSALSLYIKARSINPQAEISESNLACADIHFLGGDEMDSFINETELDRPIYRRVLEALQSELKDSEQLGSLLRLEDTISSLIQKEKERFEREGRQPMLPGWSGNQFESEAGKQEFWDYLETQIVQALNHFASYNSSKGEHRFFIGEAKKGLRYLDLVSQKYDVVATNPPYLSGRKMNNLLKALLIEQYPEGKQDLFAAFLIRCNELVNPNGLVGILTMHSYMFISSYESLRTLLRKQAAIKTMCHAGPALFAVGNPGTLQTTAVVFQHEENKDTRDNSIGNYFRLVKEPDGESKKRRFEEALNKLYNKEEDPIVYNYKQSNFDAMPGSPWVYWIIPSLLFAFRQFENLGTIVVGKHGLSTCNTFRYVRFWWEVGVDRVRRDVKDVKKTSDEGKWFPFMKGGSHKKWYGNQEFVVNWEKNGIEIKADVKHKFPYLGENLEFVLSSDKFYFKEGITWSKISSSGFSARYMPDGFIISDAGMAIYINNLSVFAILALINSKLACYILASISPTINFSIGNILSLPIPEKPTINRLNLLAEKAAQHVQNIDCHNETCIDFLHPVSWELKNIVRKNIHNELIGIEEEIDSEVYKIYGIEKNEQISIEKELSPKNIELNKKGNIYSIDSYKTDKYADTIISKLWLSYAFGGVISRFQPGIAGGLGCENFSVDINERLIGLSDPDGIMVVDEGHSDDITRKIIECLTVIFGADETSTIIKTAIGKIGNYEQLLRDYLSTKFFKDHIQLYRKRPVYWFLQSPQKKYGVWIFHERFTKDTLFRIQSEYMGPEIKLLESQIEDLRAKRDASEGRERRETEKEISSLTEILDDVREFSKRIKKITDRGYTPHIDDGVLINMAPLWELIPSWQSELKKAWQSLEKGEWDWSYQAMDHWPERVKAKCRKNKSFAIAHGLEDLYEGND